MSVGTLHVSKGSLRSTLRKKLAVRREFHFGGRVRDAASNAGRIVRRADTCARGLLCGGALHFGAFGRRIPGWPRGAGDGARRARGPLRSRSDWQKILLGGRGSGVLRLFGARSAIVARGRRPTASHGERDSVGGARNPHRGGADGGRAVVARPRRHLCGLRLGHRRIRQSTRSGRAPPRGATPTSFSARGRLANPAALSQSGEQGFGSCLDGARS